MTKVKLPKLPEGKEFEEYISALLLSAGYYLERNIIDRKGVEILELDAIATNYGEQPPTTQLWEIKSKEWHFSDLFKVRGWMDYLKLNRGGFVARGTRDNADKFEGVATSLSIDPVIASKPEECGACLSRVCRKQPREDQAFSMWRFSCWLERAMLRDLVRRRKSCKDQERFKVLDDYYFKVNSGVFFTENLLQRIDQLYSAFQENPHVSAKCGHEMVGEPFGREHDSIPRNIYATTFYDCQYTDIQLSAFVEHRARLAILKNAVDYMLFKKAGDTRRAADMTVWEVSDRKFTFFDILPGPFREGLEQITKDKYFHLYPVFWQWFLWLFGGFILKDRETEEYANLSEKTGIPVTEIPHALRSYDLLFPTNGSWLFDLPSDSHLRVVQMFPVPFMGIGANYRRLLYTPNGKYAELGLTGAYTLRDLLKWNDLLVDVLSSS